MAKVYACSGCGEEFESRDAGLSHVLKSDHADTASLSEQQEGRGGRVRLVACPTCGREVSREAAACPACGHPIVAPGKAPPSGGAIIMLFGMALFAMGVFFLVVVPGSGGTVNLHSLTLGETFTISGSVLMGAALVRFAPHR